MVNNLYLFSLFEVIFDGQMRDKILSDLSAVLFHASIQMAKV